jgi:type IV secretory pathway TrbF-like protein
VEARSWSVNSEDNSHNHAVSELQSIEAAYAVMQQRDGTAERRAWHWRVQSVLQVVINLGLAAGIVILALRVGSVKPFVQTVQVDENNHVVNLGLPQDLMSYEPQDGQWLDMLAEWVRKVRWRGADPVLAKAEWAWAYQHTCGDAKRALQHYEEESKPFVKQKKLVTVDLKSLTRTPAPLSYQVLWSETTVEASNTPTAQMYTGTFTTGRTLPANQAALLSNRLGLCVTSMDITVQP